MHHFVSIGAMNCCVANNTVRKFDVNSVNSLGACLLMCNSYLHVNANDFKR